MPRLLALLACLALVVGCTNDAKKKPPAIDDGSEAARAARGRLAVLAQATANGAYDATYTFVQHPSNTGGVIRIRQSPPQYRIDVVGKNDTASFYALRSGNVVSCSRTPKKKTCFLVARKGEEVPPLFDPGVQRLFRDAVQDLATNPTDYDVTPVPAPTGTPTPTPTATPAAVGECFTVNRTDAAPTPSPRGGFENGTYCFSEADGVATRIEDASGTMTLTKLRPAPAADAFKPITKVLKLPELTPSPTPKK